MGNHPSVTADKIVFGSMRMHEYDYPIAYWVALFSQLHDLGITTFHSSTEYESFPMYCEALSVFYTQFPEKKIRHIVKLAEPNFHIQEFSEALMAEKVAEYCTKLQTDSLHCVQWMWRGNLSDHTVRLAAFNQQYPAIEAAVLKLKAQGLVENFHCFPYDTEFAKAAIEKEAIDGLVVYRNKMETEYDPALETAARLGKHNYIIRPLFGGEALKLENETPRSLLQFALDFPNIDGAVLSISAYEKIKQII